MTNELERRVNYQEFLAHLNEINEKINNAKVTTEKEATKVELQISHLSNGVDTILSEIKELRNEVNITKDYIDLRLESFKQQVIDPIEKDISKLKEARSMVLAGWVVLCSVGYVLTRFIDNIYAFLHKP